LTTVILTSPLTICCWTLRRYIGESASFINGAIYVLIVLFLPYGIVGTWKLRALDIKAGRERLLKLVLKGKKVESDSE